MNQCAMCSGPVGAPIYVPIRGNSVVVCSVECLDRALEKRLARPEKKASAPPEEPTKTSCS